MKHRIAYLLLMAAIFSVSLTAAAQPSTYTPAQAFAAAEQNNPEAQQQLSYIAQDISQSDDDRIKALQQLVRFPGNNALVAIVRALQQDNIPLQLAAIDAAAPYNTSQRWRLLSELLTAENVSLSNAAAIDLLRSWATLTPVQQQQLAPAVERYTMQLNSQTPQAPALIELASIYHLQQRWPLSQQHYLSALVLQPDNASLYSQLADSYHQQNDNNTAIEVLQRGLVQLPDNAVLHYNLGLALLRQQATQPALTALAKASQLEPENAQYWYVYGLALERHDLSHAYQVLEQSVLLSKQPQILFALCDMQVRNHSSQAEQCIDRLALIAPPEAVSLLDEKRRQL
ncbi:hypothetical protein SIN8267_02686 [Sinobacterium norvegicum]|uniref:Tetratricopeptide repeat protein n=1 Tax=Sinobacterium norvegicum TaxID=1641715 RepID=A0ABM9AH61_9GAMM|nr:tetratricopeptide repeat protein [Sinobacterium norvegicum]CAH0992553.1 hypothetical protein SIN8267_02686 [Sinobacterium norvegicum]